MKVSLQEFNIQNYSIWEYVFWNYGKNSKLNANKLGTLRERD